MVQTETVRAEIVIAVHDLRRNIARAVRSVAVANAARAVVMCHNLPADDVAHHLKSLLADRAIAGRISLVEHWDNIASPSGPFNAGLAGATAEFVGIMGSDDELQEGAVQHWLEQAERHRADAVITRLLRQGAAGRHVVRSPIVRPGFALRSSVRPGFVRRGGAGLLDAVKDRLYYRSAPLGLMRTEFLREYDLELLPGAKSGGDLPFVARLWSLGRIASGLGGPGYIEHADAPVRVTSAPKPVAEEFASLRYSLAHVLPDLAADQQLALAVKLLRRNFLDTLALRHGGRDFNDDDRDIYQDALAAVQQQVPGAMRELPHAMRTLYRQVGQGQWDLVPGQHAVARRPVQLLIPGTVGTVASRQGALRIAGASVLIR